MYLSATATLRSTRGWVVADVPYGLADYYRSLIPPTVRYSIPRYDPHITVIRDYPTTLPVIEPRTIRFRYAPEVVIGEDYIWLDVWCEDLEALRVSLGFDNICWYTRPPSGFAPFHITLGNFKNV